MRNPEMWSGQVDTPKKEKAKPNVEKPLNEIGLTAEMKKRIDDVYAVATVAADTESIMRINAIVETLLLDYKRLNDPKNAWAKQEPKMRENIEKKFEDALLKELTDVTTKKEIKSQERIDKLVQQFVKIDKNTASLDENDLKARMAAFLEMSTVASLLWNSIDADSINFSKKNPVTEGEDDEEYDFKNVPNNPGIVIRQSSAKEIYQYWYYPDKK